MEAMETLNYRQRMPSLSRKSVANTVEDLQIILGNQPRYCIQATWSKKEFPLDEDWNCLPNFLKRALMRGWMKSSDLSRMSSHPVTS